MRNWIAGLAILAVLGIGVFAYRMATSTDTPSSSPSSIDQLRSTLRERAVMLTRGDVEGYLRAATPQARPIEEPLARGSRAVPIDEIELKAIPGRYADLRGNVFRDLPVLFIYHYKDLPADNRFEFRYLSTMERKGSSWMETAARMAPEEYSGDIREQPPVWATGPVQFDRSGHFLTLFRPGLTHERDAVALAEQARQQLVPKVLIEFDSTHLMLLAADRAQYGEMLSDPKLATSSGLATFLFTGDQVAGHMLPVNRHITLNVSVLFGEHAVTPLHGEDRVPIQVVQHELGHLALFRYMTPDTPSWLNEGGAQYLSGERRVNAWRRDIASDAYNSYTIEEIEKVWEMDRSKPLPTELYPYANAAVLSLVQAGGPQTWFDYFKGYRYTADFASGVQQSKEKPTEILLQRFYHFDRAELDRRTRAYMRTAIGLSP